MSETSGASEATSGPRPPWYADKDVPVLMYRINRRQRPQGNLFDQGEPPSFLDHLTECLLFGAEVVTTGRGRERHWMLGNREINEAAGYLAGWIGYRTEDAEQQDDYDLDSKAWTTAVVPTERRATAPFVIVVESRFLFVAKHPTFAEGTLAVVFESLLNTGEDEREVPTTTWAVEPVLDTVDFARWLQQTAVLDTVTFHVRLPNPDAAESFEQIVAHLDAQDAGALDHKLTPRDPERGLNKDFDQNPISQGLMEMARRAFALVRAKGRGAAGALRTYNQRERVRRETVRMPGEHAAAQEAVVVHGLERSRQESGSG